MLRPLPGERVGVRGDISTDQVLFLLANRIAQGSFYKETASKWINVGDLPSHQRREGCLRHKDVGIDAGKRALALPVRLVAQVGIRLCHSG